MEDDKLKDLFQGFRPELTSDSLFLNKLKRNMEAVELVKQHTEALKRRNRIAVGVAALTGFIMGVILTLLYPLISETVSSFSLTISDHGILDVEIDWRIVGWIVMGVVCVLSAINAYEITLSRLTHKNITA